MAKIGDRVKIVKDIIAEVHGKDSQHIGKLGIVFCTLIRSSTVYHLIRFDGPFGCNCSSEDEISIVQGYRKFSLGEWRDAIQNAFIAQRVIEIGPLYRKLGQKVVINSAYHDGEDVFLGITDLGGNSFTVYAKDFVITRERHKF